MTKLPVQFHGTTVYLNRAEQSVYYLLMYGSGVLFATAILIDFYVDLFLRFRK
jgi:hypothetical protein